MFKHVAGLKRCGHGKITNAVSIRERPASIEDRAGALARGVIISEVGLVPVLFTVGIMVAIYYGRADLDAKGRLIAATAFFKSPLFFSLVAGVCWSMLQLPVEGRLLTPIFHFLEVLSSANTFLVAMTVGVLLHFSGMRAILWLVLFTCLIKLILKPLLVWLPTLAMNLQDWQVQVLLLEAEA